MNLIKKAFGPWAVARLAIAAAVAASSAPLVAQVDLTGVWGSQRKTIGEGLITGAPLTLRDTDWAPQSKGEPKGKTLEEQKKDWTYVLENNLDVFKFLASQRYRPKFSAAGEQAQGAMQKMAADKPRSPYDQCLPRNLIGVPSGTVQIFMAPNRVVLVQENGEYRTVYLDRRDPNVTTPTYTGTSIGHWDGRKLMVETTNFQGETANGWPMSDQAKVDETFTLAADKSMVTVRMVYSDPKYLVEPLVRIVYLDRQPTTYELLPQSCVAGVQGAQEYAATFGDPPK